VHRRQLIQGLGACTFGAAGLVAPGGTFAQAPAQGAYDWRSVPLGGGGFVNGIVFHPKEAGLLYARTDLGGAYRFDDRTKAWVPLLDHLGRDDADLMGVLSLALDPSDPAHVYLACGQQLGQWGRGAALLASSDRGASWTRHELGIKLGGSEAGRGSGERLQVNPNDGNVLLLGTSRDGLLMSTDRGKTFRSVGFPAQHVSLVLFDPAAGAGGRTVYAGSHDKPGLYVSRDGGKGFTKEPGAPEQAPQRAVFGPDGTLYVSFAVSHSEWACNPGGVKSGSVWKRSTGGAWTDITPVAPGRNNQNFGYSGLDVDRQVPGRILVSTIERWADGDDLFLSTDGGAGWTPLAARSNQHAGEHGGVLPHYMQGSGRMGSLISDLKIDPFDSDRAVYGTGFGVFMSENLRAAQQPGGSVDWRFAVRGIELADVVEAKSPSKGAPLQVALSKVSGAAWDALDKTPGAGLFAPGAQTSRSLDLAELNPRMMARTSDQAGSGGHVSSDAGVTWQPFGPGPRVTKAPNGDQLGAGRVAVSAKGGFLVWAPDKQAALWSTDLGKTWKPSQGWPESADSSLAPVADRAIEGVFYVHDRTGGRLLISVDGGASFKPFIQGLPQVAFWQSSQLLSAPRTPRDLWLALPDALIYFAGPDQPGKSIKSVAEPWLVALGKGAPGAAYHSVYVWGRLRLGGTVSEGLFRSDDAGASFKRINDDQHRFGRPLAMAADAREHGTLYIAPQGRGVLVGRPQP
jgi:hypothetical protein